MNNKILVHSAMAITIIMLTSQNDIELAKRALDLGAVEFITKPFDSDQLKDKVTRSMVAIPEHESNGRWRPWRMVGSP